MKKTLVIVGLLAVLLSPALAMATAVVPTQSNNCRVWRNMSGVLPECTATGNCSLTSAEPCAICCMLSLVFYVTDLLFIFVMALAVIFILLAAYNILSAAGDPAKVTTGRQMIIYAAIGVAVALVAKILPFAIKAIIAPS